MTKLKPGLYEVVLSERLKRLLAELGNNRASIVDLEDAEAPVMLSNHLGEAIRKALEVEEDPSKRAEIVNKVLGVLEEINPALGAAQEAVGTNSEKAILAAVFREGETRAPVRPSTSLSKSCLFTGAAGRPQMANELVSEMMSADRVDILVSFIKRSGVTLLLRGFEALRDRNIPVRIITTCYMGASDPEAVETLSKYPNVEIKVSYDTRHTRLHAKAYYFHRETGFSTAYVGSSNMSNPAMSEGLEWNIKATRSDSEHILKAFEAEFDGYWNSDSFELYKVEAKERFRRAIAEARNEKVDSGPVVFFDITPHPYQVRILEALRVEREYRKSFHNLVVAATGTGKTIIAALDYKRYCEANGGRRPKLLFIAHRDEILNQNLATMRNVLKDPNFGARMGGDHETPAAMDHVFCTIQTANLKKIWEQLGRDFYEYIVVDEAHHAPASSYEGIFKGFAPKILLGLTATPERMDGGNILQYFGNRIAAELRLPEALDEKLLCPFQYFGVADPVSVEDDRFWQAGKYSIGALEQAYVEDSTQADSRVRTIIDALNRYQLGELAKTKGIGFCVSIKHANYMAERFTQKGIPSIAVTSETDDDTRKRAVRDLKAGTIKFVFTVDLFNEGLDVPEVNTVLFLRPTDSLTVFLQQLGRGLRHSKGKDYLQVLDFVAQMHKKYRVDRKFAALLPGTRYNIEREIEHGFPHVPPGCSIHLEKQAMDAVLRNIRAAYSNLRNYIPETIKTFKQDTGKELTLTNYLDAYAIEPERMFKDRTWTQWKAAAGVIAAPTDPDLDILSPAVARACQITAPGHLGTIKDLPQSGISLISEAPAAANMIYSLLWDVKGENRGISTIQDSFHRLAQNPSILADLREVADYQLDITTCAGRRPYPLPLELHGHYTNNEIQAAFGRDTFNESTQRGVGLLHFPGKRAYVALITLNKSEKDFSATTLYKDYPISLTKMHWESPSTTSQNSPTGSNLINHAEKGYEVFLFVRLNRDNGPLTAPFQFLGRAERNSFEGERPIAMVWDLEYPMPAELLEAKRVGG